MILFSLYLILHLDQLEIYDAMELRLGSNVIQTSERFDGICCWNILLFASEAPCQCREISISCGRGKTYISLEKAQISDQEFYSPAWQCPTLYSSFSSTKGGRNTLNNYFRKFCLQSKLVILQISHVWATKRSIWMATICERCSHWGVYTQLTWDKW